MYADYLGTPFPFPSYTHLFLPPQMLLASCQVSPGLAFLSDELLVDGSAPDQVLPGGAQPALTCAVVTAGRMGWDGVRAESEECCEAGWHAGKAVDGGIHIARNYR